MSGRRRPGLRGLPFRVWHRLRPRLFGIFEALPGPIRRPLWALYWHVWLRLRWWAWYPVMNPRITRMAAMLAAGAAIAATARRLYS